MSCQITPEDIDDAILRLAERRRLKGGKRVTEATGMPLAGSTVNRYLTQVGSIFKHARRLKLVPRASFRPKAGSSARLSDPTPNQSEAHRDSPIRGKYRAVM
jgi:hypothetical protein